MNASASLAPQSLPGTGPASSPFRLRFLIVILLAAALPSGAAAQQNSLLLPVEDVFSIGGVGTVVTGTVERGSVSVGDQVELVGPDGNRRTLVTQLQAGRRDIQTANAGDDVGMALRGMDRDDVARGMVVAAPGSIRPQGAVRVRVEPLSSPLPADRFWDGRSGRVQAYIRTTDVGVRWYLPDGMASIPTGTAFDLWLDLSRPWPVEEGQQILLRRGGRTVATAEVEEVLF